MVKEVFILYTISNRWYVDNENNSHLFAAAANMTDDGISLVAFLSHTEGNHPLHVWYWTLNN